MIFNKISVILFQFIFLTSVGGKLRKIRNVQSPPFVPQYPAQIQNFWPNNYPHPCFRSQDCPDEPLAPYFLPQPEPLLHPPTSYPEVEQENYWNIYRTPLEMPIFQPWPYNLQQSEPTEILPSFYTPPLNSDDIDIIIMMKPIDDPTEENLQPTVTLILSDDEQNIQENPEVNAKNESKNVIRTSTKIDEDPEIRENYPKGDEGERQNETKQGEGDNKQGAITNKIPEDESNTHILTNEIEYGKGFDPKLELYVTPSVN